MQDTVRPVLSSLRMKNFKGLRDAELHLGPFTVLVGANASGKSNVRDALRFLHGVGRGYSLAEIFGEKYSEGGELVWEGIRGGTREAAFFGSQDFEMEVAGDANLEVGVEKIVYSVQVLPKEKGGPQVAHEALDRWSGNTREPVFRWPIDPNVSARLDDRLTEEVGRARALEGKSYTPASRPMLHHLGHTGWTRFGRPGDWDRGVREMGTCLTASVNFEYIRFFDFDPDQMREYSAPGANRMGHRGENLSSVLMELWENPATRESIKSWLSALTPMDVADMAFPADASGRVLLEIIEPGGRRVSAHSVSDGTLRFLAMLGALLSPHTRSLYFFEEIETGLHPTRLHLLVDLIESRVRNPDLHPLQVVATTHSPMLMSMLSEQSRQDASLVYRLEGTRESRIRRIVEFPEVQEVLEREDWGRLMESGWMENTAHFSEPEREESVP